MSSANNLFNAFCRHTDDMVIFDEDTKNVDHEVEDEEDDYDEFLKSFDENNMAGHFAIQISSFHPDLYRVIVVPKRIKIGKEARQVKAKCKAYNKRIHSHVKIGGPSKKRVKPLNVPSMYWKVYTNGNMHCLHPAYEVVFNWAINKELERDESAGGDHVCRKWDCDRYFIERMLRSTVYRPRKPIEL
jgi:hypothetical protein